MSLTLSLFRLSLIFFCLSAAFSMSIPMSVPMSTPLANAIPFMSPDKLEEMRSNVQDFIKHMGIPHEKFLTPDDDEDNDPMWNEELSFGDLMMEEEREESEESSSNEAQDGFESGGSSSGSNKPKKHKKPKKWTQKDIPYYISKEFKPKQRRFIERAIEDMNSKLSVVRFRPYQENDQNYVMVFNGKGCFSKLGMVGGQQPMSLQSSKCLKKKGTVQHEFMHVLGFSHTQNRPDRDGYIKILYDHIPKQWYKDYVRLDKSETIFLGKYDYFSVLHYPLRAPKSNGKKMAMQVLEKNINPKQVGLQKKLTENDIAMARELYSS